MPVFHLYRSIICNIKSTTDINEQKIIFAVNISQLFTYEMEHRKPQNLILLRHTFNLLASDSVKVNTKHFIHDYIKRPNMM